VKKPTIASDADLKARIRTSGLKATNPRILVLRSLLAQETPASHADLCEVLGRAGLDRATIYRNLKDLAGAGLVTRIDLGDHIWRFEAMREGHPGHGICPHFVCRACGKVSRLPNVRVRIVRKGRAPKSLGTKDISIQITALCDDCT